MTRPLPDELPADPDTRLEFVGALVADRVEAAIPGYIVTSVTRIVDAWGRLDNPARIAARSAAAECAPAVAERTGADLRAQLAQPASKQRQTPLEITARIIVEPTAILRDLGIPPVARDPADAARQPDDFYDLVPRALADLGDPDLGPLQMAWGLAKHEALRRNR